ncbi:hypothetical protein CD351_05525 [Erythrobacter sp. KY5]|uniref:DUF4350 domain-containing protein n=1 Tax=Erythrobacter sp. KY5 TaxID=2011159 RepID=UPI000DBF237F|nr:DUF4350 domain-containing protein [Erythrobacter sp. KY5]AWW73883.1 hypothetical protein CD351_05525 [Erythrobacter sp. KY5]
MKRIATLAAVLVAIAIIVAGSWLLYTQQIADPDYAPAIAAPQWEGENPTLVVDAGHSNFHQIAGRFAPFAKLASHGGYQVASTDEPLTAGNLSMDILVIANAGKPLETAEIDAVVDWVEGGGSLLLIADHAPFGGHASSLAERFGVGMGDGFVVTGPPDNVSGTIDFGGELLGDHPITTGRATRPERIVSRVRSFLGQSLSAPAGAVPLLLLPDDAAEFASRDAVNAYVDGGEEGVDVSTRVQALAMEYGQGRIVVSGEAAMFTAQIQRGKPETRIAVTEADNEAYVLNILDWLARRVSDAQSLADSDSPPN